MYQDCASVWMRSSIDIPTGSDSDNVLLLLVIGREDAAGHYVLCCVEILVSVGGFVVLMVFVCHNYNFSGCLVGDYFDEIVKDLFYVAKIKR